MLCLTGFDIYSRWVPLLMRFPDVVFAIKFSDFSCWHLLHTGRVSYKPQRKRKDN